MKANLYRIECLTNLHVGNGDMNYSIIDNEVERDLVLNLPTINASGVKGALREFLKENENTENKIIKEIFGQEPKGDSSQTEIYPGKYKFLSANLLSRPLRVSQGNISYINVTTTEIIEGFLKLIKDFNIKEEDSSQSSAVENPQNVVIKKDHLEKLEALISEIKKENNSEFYYKDSEFCIEGKKINCKIDENNGNTSKKIGNGGDTSKETGNGGDTSEETVNDGDTSEEIVNNWDTLKEIVGENCAITNNFSNYDFPVVARNQLENGESKNLWYEEIVPYKSTFYFIILTPEDDKNLEKFEKIIMGKEPVQFGGNASIGQGYCKITKILVKEKSQNE